MALAAGAQVATTAAPDPSEQETLQGERLPLEAYGPGVIETWADVAARAAELDATPHSRRDRNGAFGAWFVPGMRATFEAHSGLHYATNKWGDPAMGIGFNGQVDFVGAWIGGQAGPGVWPPALRILGFRAGSEVAQSEWLHVGAEPEWLACDFESVDRIVFQAQPAVNGAAWYTVDDLTFVRPAAEPGAAPSEVVVTFEDLDYDAALTGTDYAGLVWERGTRNFDAMPPPFSPPDDADPELALAVEEPMISGPGATAPTIEDDFAGIEMGTNGQFSFPPDTHGAVGLDHFVTVVNSNFGVYLKASGVKVQGSSLGSFQPGTSGDPRIKYDTISNRWVVISTNFNNRLYLAVSLTSDPTGAWFKTNFLASTGSDTGCFPDFPTLGIDENGIYTAASMIGCGYTIFAIDKAPLIAGSPSLGTVTAFRNLSSDGGALQPCLTYGTGVPAYVISRSSSTGLRVRTVNPPLASPTLTQVGFITIPSHLSPPNAPALGASTPIDTGDSRLLNAVYRDGFIYTCQTIGLNGRAASRWYQVDPAALSLIQSGSVSDLSLHYYYPSIAVNAAGDLAMGFTGSNSSTSPSCFVTGRTSGDTPGAMAAPLLYKAGSGSNYNLIDNFGRNRWGDYSHTSTDPVDETTFWTIQEYVKGNNDWGTWIARTNPNSDAFPVIYCTPKISSAFCINFIGTSANAQPISGANDYSVTCTDVQGFKNGLLFAGITGPASAPFSGGTLCISPPTKRGPVMNSGGTSTTSCDGSYSQLVNDGVAIPFGFDAGVGHQAWYQYWYRDPANGMGNLGTALSNAVELTFF